MKVPLRYATRPGEVRAIQFRGNNEAECADFSGRDFKCPLDGYLVKFENGDVVAMAETAFLHLFEIS
jgi:hypothetical protein